MDNDPPAIKPWGIADKERLQQLTDKGKADITKTDYKYINKVKHCYFHPHNERNFRQNFKNYAPSRELKDKISGARRRERDIVF